MHLALALYLLCAPCLMPQLELAREPDLYSALYLICLTLRLYWGFLVNSGIAFAFRRSERAQSTDAGKSFSLMFAAVFSVCLTPPWFCFTARSWPHRCSRDRVETL
jgi:hypothetical protein